jgi:hypothetical protein
MRGEGICIVHDKLLRACEQGEYIRVHMSIQGKIFDKTSLVLLICDLS